MRSGGWDDVAGFVLAGGRSSRMGTDKALADFGGEPLIARAVRLLRESGVEVSIAGAHSKLSGIAPVIEDREPDQGPLAGVCAALAATSAPWALFLSVDLPLLPVSLLEYLLRRALVAGSAVTLVSVNGFPQTFPVVLRRDLLPLLHNELTEGRRGCFAAFHAAAAHVAEAVAILPAELLAQAGQAAHRAWLPPCEWFLNVNTPEQLRRAQRLIAHPIA